METTDLIDWESLQSHVLLNPRMPMEERRIILATLESTSSLPGHIWLSASGSSGALKCVALSKKAILNSAAAVNRHLQCNGSDTWINPLPTFHIGGLAIRARHYLGGGKFVESGIFGERWNPHQFIEQAIKVKATLTALVPTQIFDLLKEKLHAPPSLRAVVIGGGALSKIVYEQAVNLGWPVLPSYGSTECASQVATAPLFSWESGSFPLLQPLDHVKLSVDNEGSLQIFGESLLTCYGFPDLIKGTCQFIDPKINGWLTTADRVILENGSIRAISREENFVKIGGESVDLLRLDKILEEVRFYLLDNYDMSIFAMPHDRLGYVIHLAIAAENHINIDVLLKDFHARVHPYEHIRQVHYVTIIPRTALKKVIRKSLVMQIAIPAGAKQCALA